MTEGITITFDAIQQRLLTSRELFQRNEGIEESRDEAIQRSLRSRYGDSRLARTDDLITPDQVTRISHNAQLLRNGIFLVGSPFTLHTKYPAILDSGGVTEEEALQLFFVENGDIALRAELDKPKIGEGEKIGIMADGNPKVYLGLDFRGHYWLNMEFGDEDSESYVEYDRQLPLSGMTVEEYYIFANYIRVGKQIIHERT